MTETMAHPRPELGIALALGLPSTRPLSVRLAEWYAGRAFDPTEPEDSSDLPEESAPEPSRENVIDLDALAPTAGSTSTATTRGLHPTSLPSDHPTADARHG
jgi:hypothetical protein